jgi:hypothetical protein
MPLNIGSTAGGSVTLSSGSTATATTLTLPAVNGTVLTTAATITVAQGGTGAATLAANNVLLGNGTSALQTVAPGTSGNVLNSSGTTWQSSALSGGTGISISGLTVTNTGVTSLVAGSGISISASTGSVTITNTQAVIPAGTAMLFYQAAAPTGWTQVTTVNDRALRVVSGSGGVTGGTTAYSTYFNGSFSVGSTTITEAQMPSHTHAVTDPGHTHGIYPGGGNNAILPSADGVQGGSGGSAAYYINSCTRGQLIESVVTGITINATGSSTGHAHTIPSLQYADVIICSKN